MAVMRMPMQGDTIMHAEVHIGNRVSCWVDHVAGHFIA